jgi:hypothetical protein
MRYITPQILTCVEAGNTIQHGVDKMTNFPDSNTGENNATAAAYEADE